MKGIVKNKDEDVPRFEVSKESEVGHQSWESARKPYETDKEPSLGLLASLRSVCQGAVKKKGGGSSSKSNERELKLIEAFEKKVQYESRSIHPVFEDIWNVLTFTEMWEPLQRAAKAGDIRRCAFIVVAACLDWVCTLLQVLFIPIFIYVGVYCMVNK